MTTEIQNTKISTKIKKRLSRIKEDIQYIEGNLQIGRPTKNYSKVKKAMQKGMTIDEAVKKFKISRSTAYKIFNA